MELAIAILAPFLFLLIVVGLASNAHVWFGNQLEARRNYKLELKKEERRLIEAKNERDRLAIEAARAELINFDRRHPQLPPVPQDDEPS